MSELKKEFKVKFRGVRGSHPVSASNRLKYGGNTSCVEITANGHTIIFDAGTGIIEAGNDLLKKHIASGTNLANRKPVEAIVLFSHSHMDHIQGMPFFKPAYINKTKLYLFGPRTHGKDFEQFVSDSIFKLFFPVDFEDVPAEIKIHNLKEHLAIILNPKCSEPEIVSFTDEEEIKTGSDSVIITCYKSPAHPKEGVYIFKVKCNGKSLVYATDKESYIGGDIRLMNFSRGADLLIHDAQYTMEDYVFNINSRQGFGHSTPEMAIEAAKNINASQLVLYHIDPSYDDSTVEKLEEKARGLFNNSMFAHENLEIDMLQVKCKS